MARLRATPPESRGLRREGPEFASPGTPPVAGSGKPPWERFPVEDGMQPALPSLSQLLVFCYSLRSLDKQFLLPCDRC